MSIEIPAQTQPQGFGTGAAPPLSPLCQHGKGASGTARDLDVEDSRRSYDSVKPQTFIVSTHSYMHLSFSPSLAVFVSLSSLLPSYVSHTQICLSLISVYMSNTDI